MILPGLKAQANAVGDQRHLLSIALQKETLLCLLQNSVESGAGKRVL